MRTAENDGEILDEIAIERRCNGDRTVSLNRAEANEAFIRLQSAGLTAPAIAELLGVSHRAITRWRSGVRPKSLSAAPR